MATIIVTTVASRIHEDRNGHEYRVRELGRYVRQYEPKSVAAAADLLRNLTLQELKYNRLYAADAEVVPDGMYFTRQEFSISDADGWLGDFDFSSPEAFASSPKVNVQDWLLDNGWME